MGLVFSILPQTKRIFLFTRPTDVTALEMYAAMGFEKDENPFEDSGHKINRQYLTRELQNSIRAQIRARCAESVFRKSPKAQQVMSICEKLIRLCDHRICASKRVLQFPLTTLNYRIENSKILQMATETMKYE